MPDENTCDETIAKTIRQQIDWLFIYWKNVCIKKPSGYFYKNYHYEKSGCIKVVSPWSYNRNQIFGFKNIVLRYQYDEIISVYITKKKDSFFTNKMIFFPRRSMSERTVVFKSNIKWTHNGYVPVFDIFKQGNWVNNIDILYKETQEENQQARYGRIQVSKYDDVARRKAQLLDMD